MKKTSLLILFALLVSFNRATAQGLFRISQDQASKKVDVLIDGKLFTSLLYADSLKKHVLYPVKTTEGATVTRGWPIEPQKGDQIDHPHQIGVWFNYGDVNGADYWNNSTKIDTNKKPYGTIKVRLVKNIKAGKGRAEFTVAASWLNPGGLPVLEETTRYIFREEQGLRLISRETLLKALQGVSLKDNKEGLFAIRVSRQLEAKSDKPVAVYLDKNNIKKIIDPDITTGVYESSRGVKGEEVFGTRSEWLKLTGTVDAKPVAVVLMDHPSNINYPGFWMARGYGLFAINPLGAEFYTGGKERLNFSLEKGKRLSFKHQLVIGSKLDSSRINKLHQAFAKE
ncbi:PmoA family protein [Pedobacter sp. SYSU D00535]|uniref:DUF6807 domain-containing protein n=1 Tax=Pedobacter sp. SYSU D00535 TaxID=2810308 RepID=UPI001A9780A7|nr:PmoA family protein [Pedobacter sp. SYSU D00535]